MFRRKAVEVFWARHGNSDRPDGTAYIQQDTAPVGRGPSIVQGRPDWTEIGRCLGLGLGGIGMLIPSKGWPAGDIDVDPVRRPCSLTSSSLKCRDKLAVLH